jgi:hypothetical protein
VGSAALTIRGMDPERLIGLSRRPDGAVVIGTPDGRTHVCYTDTQIAAAIRKTLADRSIPPPTREPAKATAKASSSSSSSSSGQRGTQAEIEAGRLVGEKLIDKVAESITDDGAVAAAGAMIAKRAGGGIWGGLRKLSRRGPPPKPGSK